MERVGSYLSYRGTRLADQAIENRAEADSIELESNSTTNRRWKIRLTCGPLRQRNKGREQQQLRLLGRPTRARERKGETSSAPTAHQREGRNGQPARVGFQAAEQQVRLFSFPFSFLFSFKFVSKTILK
jgi:hypothetical protein